ncbi:MAG TPA: ABC transporter ATP-binding protein [Pseudobdellovibrionaceae bacterium]|jgi:putative ABC transport system ATP-binding protein
MIQIENLYKTYQLGETKVPALRGLNFRVQKGDFRALLGASGSGKSTLLHLLATLDTPDQGRLLFMGQDLATLNEDQKSDLRNSKISMIFQNFNLIPALNVKQNIELPLILRSDLSDEEKEQRIRIAINDVGLNEHMNHKPDQLSGGQRQRVAIARALVPQPELILADEPTANLDSATAHQVIDLLLDLNQKRNITFLFATHDEKLIQRVKNLSWIVDGVIKTTP